MKNKFLMRIIGAALGLSMAIGTGVAIGSTLGSTRVNAADEVFYTLTPAKGSNNSYAGNCDVAIEGITWNVTGNATMTPWRIGGKSLSGVDRAVYSKKAMGDAITKVELKVGAASSITINSLKLKVCSDSSFNTQLDEVSVTFAENSTLTFSPTSGGSWATGAYYKFIFNVSVSGSSNKFVEFTKAEFYHTAASQSSSSSSSSEEVSSSSESSSSSSSSSSSEQATTSTLVINTTSFTSTSSGSGYAAYDGDRDIDGYSINSFDVMINSGLQFRSNSGWLHNKTYLGIIKKITLATTTNFTIYLSSSEISSKPSSGTTITSGTAISGTYGYFAVVGGASTPKTASITIEYEAKYPVIYNANGATTGEVPTDSSSPYDSGATVTVLGNTGTLAKTGYTWSGWNTKDDGTGTDYAAGNTFEITSSVTLYAKWAINTYTVTWKNGDTTLDTDTVNYNTTPSYSGETPTKAATAQYTYTFSGWNTSADGTGTELTSSYKVTDDVTFFAQFDSTVNKYSVSGSIINGSLSPESSVDYGSIYSGTISASDGYKIPTTIGVTVNSVAIGTDSSADTYYTYDLSTGAVTVVNVTAAVVISASCSEIPSYTITKTVTNGSATGASKIYKDIGTSTTISLSADDGYKLPSSIKVESGETTLVKDTNYTYTVSSLTSGSVTITINEDYEGDIVITVVCVALANNSIDVSINGVVADANNATSVIEGSAVTLTFAAASDYYLPDTVTVTGAEYVWSKATGELLLEGGTSNISVTIIGVAKVLTETVLLLDEDKGDYTLGDSFQMPAVLATFNGGDEYVTANAEYSGYDPYTIGEQTVTISYTYKGTTATATYTANVSVKARTSETYYALVTSDVTSLAAGDKIVITRSGTPTTAMAAYSSGNNCGVASKAPTVSNGKITALGGAAELTLSTADSTKGTFYLNDGTYYLYAASSSSNHLKGSTETSSTDGAWKFTYSNNTMSVVADGSSNRNVMQYNSGSSLFSCYASASQTAVAVYKKVTVDTTVDVLIRLTATGPADNAKTEEDVLTPSDFVASALFDTSATPQIVTPTITNSNNGTPNTFTLVKGSNTINLSYTDPNDANNTKTCSVTVVAAERTAVLDGIVWSLEDETRTVFEESTIGSFGTLEKHYDDDNTATLSLDDCTVALYSKSNDTYIKVSDIDSPTTYTWQLADNGKYLGVTYESYTLYSGEVTVVETLESITGFTVQEKTATWTLQQSTTAASNSNPVLTDGASIDDNISMRGYKGDAGTAIRFWNDGIRSYDGGNTLVFTATNDAKIKSISLGVTGLTCDKGTESSTSGLYEVLSPKANDSITLSGWTGQKVTSSIVVTYDLPVENDNIANTDAGTQKAVLDFVSTMNTQLAVCNGTTGATDATELAAAWTAIKTAYGNAKKASGVTEALFVDMLKFASSSESGDKLQKALARYDYIITKYGTSTYEDFLGRVSAGSISVTSPRTNITNPFSLLTSDSSSMVIVIISVVSLASIGGYSFLRKRKEY